MRGIGEMNTMEPLLWYADGFYRGFHVWDCAKADRVVMSIPFNGGRTYPTLDDLPYEIMEGTAAKAQAVIDGLKRGGRQAEIARHRINQWREIGR